jgi:Fe-S-cluster containining protein
MERNCAKVHGDKSRQAPQFRENSGNQKVAQMVEKRKTNEKLLREIKNIYDWLDSQVEDKLSKKCSVCGNCCDFAAFDHRLYVTISEIMYLAANLEEESFKPMQTGRCPYNINGKCTVYDYRFSGCRIFNCKGDADIQSELSEKALEKFKSLCTKFNISYRYMDLSSGLLLKPLLIVSGKYEL